MPAVLDKPTMKTSQHADRQPHPYRFSRQDYYKMVEKGLFNGQRVELIEGEIIDMSPMNNPHAVGIYLTQETLRSAFGSDFFIRVQMPMRATPSSEPEPDIAVVATDPRSWTDHPETALLVVEISGDTLSFDRSKKAALYARMGIEDYWIVNLNEPQLEVYRKPQKDKSGWRYGTMEIFRPQDTVRPLAAAKAKIKVADMLP